MKFKLSLALSALVLGSALSMGSLRAADAPAIPAGNPKDVSELKAIQEKVKAVIKKNLPATVGIDFGNAQGSGVIVSKDGTVLTAGHVSGTPGQDCNVVMPDGKKYKAKTLGANNGIDSGMIKIVDKAPAGGWPTVEIGTTDNLTAGEWTVALGHPGGYQKGRPPVARLGRVIMATSKLIATDNTLINGDSGGPLFDLDGKLVGIHSRIGMSSQQNIHVPINTFTETWERLAASEQWGQKIAGTERPAARVSLGITVNETDKGCCVTKVNEDSPAAAAGIQVGDIIQKFSTREIKTPDDMVTALSGIRRPGEVTMTVLREDKTVELKPVLTRRQ